MAEAELATMRHPAPDWHAACGGELRTPHWRHSVSPKVTEPWPTTARTRDKKDEEKDEEQKGKDDVSDGNDG